VCVCVRLPPDSHGLKAASRQHSYRSSQNAHPHFGRQGATLVNVVLTNVVIDLISARPIYRVHGWQNYKIFRYKFL
jgi:hypothetical protein